MAVPDQLPRFVAGVGEPQPVNHIVQTTLQEDQEIGARNPLLPLGFGEEVSELVFRQPVHPFYFLLLPELDPVVGKLGPALAVLSRRIASALDPAFFGIAPVSLKIKF
jgi:hypothetical protein